MILKVQIILLLSVLFGFLPAETHIFWYKAFTKGYDLQANPGPNLPTDALIHEGMIASSSGDGSSSPFWFLLGNGGAANTRHGRSSSVWSHDLNEMVAEDTSLITLALLRGEFKDGFSDNPFCSSGPLVIRCGIADFYPQLTDYWGGNDQVGEDAAWQDYDNLLSYSGTGYDQNIAALEAEEILQMTAPEGRPASGEEPSVLDKQFFEINITDQVKWILANTCEHKGAKSGQYAIVFLTNPNILTDSGKVILFSDEMCGGNTGGSDLPWTSDGNTIHMVIETAANNLIDASEKMTSVKNSPILELNSIPNPMSGSATISFNTLGQKGTLKIFSANGKMVHSAAVSGQGSIQWNAKELSNGIYASRLTVGNQVISKTLILLR